MLNNNAFIDFLYVIYLFTSVSDLQTTTQLLAKERNMTTIDKDYPDRLIDKRELKTLVGLSHQHILRLEKAGNFPRRIQIAENSVRWRLSDILNWIDVRSKVTPVAHQKQKSPFTSDLFSQ